MTKRTPTTRFGDAPRSPSSQTGAPGVRGPGTPLPLLTQPMMSSGPDDGSMAPSSSHSMSPSQASPSQARELLMATRIDNPLAPTGGAIYARDTKATAIVAVQNPRMPNVQVGPPPEIGLTQHHLPDEPPDARLELVIDPDSERSAAFRVLRHHLLEIGRPQCIVVSSPMGGDGKTTTAANLALALAECGRAKVLLVETHVRRPQLASMFKFIPPWCFAEQLAAHRQQPMLPWSLVEIPSLWLHVGAINPRIEKSQLLDGPAFAIAMERLRLGGYDHIVVDGPPVLGSADANLMSDAADAVVLALRARRSTVRDLKRAVDQLGSNRVVGTVLVQE
ncbi:MAG: P-loop NTPase [Proteobacteria bacterium]|nr:P-loop NTPase [Pseudomonadota bacterium]